MKKKYICISGTNYNILLFCLIHDFLNKTIFFIPPLFKMEENENIYYYADHKGKIGRVLDVLWNSYVFYKIQLKFFRNRTPILLVQDHMLLSYIFLQGRPYSLIEDGIANYRESDTFFNKYYKLPSWLRTIKKKLGFLPHLGVSEQATTIYLRGLLPTPSTIQSKVKVIDIFALWREKTEEEKQWIQNFFQVQEEELQLLKGKKKILFTQPLSEDRILTEEEKVKIYQKILEKYGQEEVLIKTHPREQTDYQKYFPKVSVLKTTVPMELYLLLGVEVEEVITLFSTVVYSYLHSRTKIRFYGTGIHPKIKKRFQEDNFGIEVTEWVDG